MMDVAMTEIVLILIGISVLMVGVCIYESFKLKNDEELIMPTYEEGQRCPCCVKGKLTWEQGKCYCSTTPFPPCMVCENGKLVCPNCKLEV